MQVILLHSDNISSQIHIKGRFYVLGSNYQHATAVSIRNAAKPGLPQSRSKNQDQFMSVLDFVKKYRGTVNRLIGLDSSIDLVSRDQQPFYPMEALEPSLTLYIVVVNA